MCNESVFEVCRKFESDMDELLPFIPEIFNYRVVSVENG